MRKIVFSSLLAFAVTTAVTADLYAQCTGETANITNRCPGQQPQVDITPVVAGTDYFWFDLIPKVPGPGNDTLKLGNGNSVVYPSPLGASETFYYQKQIHATGGPAVVAPAIPSGVTPSNNAGDIFDIPVTSTSDYKVNAVTVAVHIYSCDASKEYRLKVQTATSSSQWYYFKCSDMIATSNSQVKLVRVPVMKTATEQGITVPSGASAVRVITAADGLEKAGSIAVDGLDWFDKAAFTNTYAIGGATTFDYLGATTTINGNANKTPGLFDWDITTLCPVQTINITPSSVGCCVPGNVTQPVVTSSTGSMIVNTVPISPAMTLSAPLQSGYYYQWLKDGVPLGAPTYEGVNKNSISVTAVGKYTLKVAESSTHITKASCTKTDLVWVQKRILFAEADKTTICLGETVNLLAKGATGPTSWTPTSSALVNPNTVTPDFTPTTTGSFPLVVTGEVPVGNQIINGDFEQGNVQVNPSPTYYVYKDPATATNTTPNYAIGYPNRQALVVNVGQYTINNYVFWPGFQAWLPIQDHTTGTGKFLYVDASGQNQPGTTKYLWSQDVIVQPNTNYEFAAWVTNFNGEGDPGYVIPPGYSGININVAANPLPDLMLYINDVPAFASPPVISATVGLWQKISTTWNSGSNSGVVKLKFAEIFPGPGTGGHDFALDDISFGAPGTQTDNITITVNDCFTLTANATACTGDSVTLSASTNGIFTKWENITAGAGSPTSIGIKSPTSSTTKAKSETGVSTSFRATAKFIFGNQIVNPDFEDGNAGFTTTYTTANPTSAMNPGQKYVGLSPTAFNPSSPTFYVNVPDHTTGLATDHNYYVGDSRYDASRNIAYRTTVSVVSGTEYGFSGWFTNALQEFTKATPDTNTTASYPNGGKTTKLDLYINNQFVRRIQLPVNNNWNNYTALWTAGITGNVNLELRSVNGTPFGSLPSMFAMDDLQFGKIHSVTKTVPVTTPPCSLPVEFIQFKADNLVSTVELFWQTAQEKNAQAFIVERSSDAVHFEAIGRVEASGNSSTVRSYSYSDKEPLQGIVYYRLKQVDRDGVFMYSEIRTVVSVLSQLVTAYPNPSDNTFTLLVRAQASEAVHAVLYSITGVAIENVQCRTNEECIIGAGLSSGTYLLQISTSEGVQTLKLIKR